MAFMNLSVGSGAQPVIRPRCTNFLTETGVKDHKVRIEIDVIPRQVKSLGGLSLCLVYDSSI